MWHGEMDCGLLFCADTDVAATGRQWLARIVPGAFR